MRAILLSCLILITSSLDSRGGPRYTPADVEALIKKIDHRIVSVWKRERIKPTVQADDAEYLRRVYLDLAGRIPPVSEVRAFLRDTSPKKRQQLVTRLLRKNPHRFVSHFSRVWRSWMLPEVNSNFQLQFLIPGFQGWLENQFRKDVSYDQMVRDLLTVPLPRNARGSQFLLAGQSAPSPMAYYQTREHKPENLGAATSRLFLGVRLECAQCHDHPFAKWGRDQFWSYASFFAGLSPRVGNNAFRPSSEDVNKHSLTIPGTKRTVQATYLDGGSPTFPKGVSPRKTLADWMTSPKNPFFAKALVNRMWEYFLGTAIVEPVDEMVGTESEASHPKLLEDLANAFVKQGFDLKFLIESILGSRAYQLSSRQTDSSQADPTLFARMPLRGLTGDQLFDSVAEATGFQGGAQNVPTIGRQGTPRQQFLRQFQSQTGKKTDVQTSILQALAMMNGSITTSATSLNRSQTLMSVIYSPFMNTRERIETLGLSTLSRKLTQAEIGRYERFIQTAMKGRTDKTKAYMEAVADVFWVMLNSSELMFNH